LYESTSCASGASNMWADSVLYAEPLVQLDAMGDAASWVGSSGKLDSTSGTAGTLTGDLLARGRIKHWCKITRDGNVLTHKQIFDATGTLCVTEDTIEGARSRGAGATMPCVFPIRDWYHLPLCRRR
jgi:hypothetical protein